WNGYRERPGRTRIVANWTRQQGLPDRYSNGITARCEIERVE
ncbi:MAG: hypothetical protein H6R48_937, partial [Proteobacteria bacterium]|nr:hypothetical protein [Pseudomonadota bacterium]